MISKDYLEPFPLSHGAFCHNTTVVAAGMSMVLSNYISKRIISSPSAIKLIISSPSVSKLIVSSPLVSKWIISSCLVCCLPLVTRACFKPTHTNDRYYLPSGHPSAPGW